LKQLGHSASPVHNLRPNTPIGNSLTSFTRVVAADIPLRIAIQTLQTIGQASNQSNRLIFQHKPVCYSWTAVLGPQANPAAQAV